MTVRVGIVGAGMIGQEHAHRLSGQAGAQVTAVADADQGRAEQVARSVPGAQPLRTGHDVIGSGAVDAVLVTSSGPSHEEFVLAAVGAGKPVFCEKPLAPTPEACLRIVEAELAAGRRLVQVGFMRRYDDGYQAMKRALDDGLIGTPLLAHCVHRNAASPPTYTSDMPFTDSAVHEMDIVRWLLADEVTALSVVAARRSRYAPGQLQDPQLLLMETAAGVHIDVELFVNCQYGYDVRCELVGETGTVSLAAPAGSRAAPRRRGQRAGGGRLAGAVRPGLRRRAAGLGGLGAPRLRHRGDVVGRLRGGRGGPGGAHRARLGPAHPGADEGTAELLCLTRAPPGSRSSAAGWPGGRTPPPTAPRPPCSAWTGRPSGWSRWRTSTGRWPRTRPGATGTAGPRRAGRRWRRHRTSTRSAWPPPTSCTGR